MSCEIEKSTHVCEVVPIELTKHPNADSLSIVPVWGYSCVGRTSDWQGVQKGIFIPPDSLVDTTRPEFSFLAKEAKGNGLCRIKTRKLRGIVSYGLLIPAPEDAQLGENWAEKLNVSHYEPEIEREKGLGGKSRNVKAPVHFSKYDIDSGLRWCKLFDDGERVFCTEKINGQNWRCLYKDGQFYVGSRNYWKENIETCLFWKTFHAHPEVEKFLRDNPNYTIFGESYGNVGGYRYALPAEAVRLAVFDLFDMEKGTWVDFEQAREIGKDLPWTPILADMPWDLERAKFLSEGPTVLGNAAHIREGIVISPEKERWHPKAGRVKFKLINPEYS